MFLKCASEGAHVNMVTLKGVFNQGRTNMRSAFTKNFKKLRELGRGIGASHFIKREKYEQPWKKL